jgi:hypothetical protein
METSTSTGTGDLTLDGAVSGFQTFSDAIGTNVCCYEIHAVDANDVPTGEREVGIGAQSASALVRKSVLSSSNSDALVSFSAGKKIISNVVPAAFAASIRRQASGVLNFYVRTDGSDGNDGLENTSARAFLTVQGALNAVALSSECGASNVNINIGSGTFTGSFLLPRASRIYGAAEFNIIGTGSGTSLSCGSPYVATVEARNSGRWKLSSIAIAAPSGGVGLLIGQESTITLGSGVIFDDCQSGHVSVVNGGVLTAASGYSISYGAASGHHILCESCGSVKISGTVTFTASATFGQPFARCVKGLGHIDIAGVTFDLGAYSVTGQRYNINANGVCWTNGGGASFVPGNSAGAVTNGGVYL